MERRELRRALARVAEGILSVALVVVAFLAVLFLLGLSFPEGTGLRSLMTGGGFQTADREGGGRRFEFADQFRREPPQETSIIASLSHTLRKVKDKPAGSIAWSTSVRGKRLRDRHAIQTFERSGAFVDFDEGSSLRIGENSLVVLRKLSTTRATPGRRASMVVLEGELEAKVAGRGGLPTEMEIATPGGTAIVRSSGVRGREADLRVTVNEDRSSTIALFEGVAEILSRGRSVQLERNQALKLGSDGTLGAPVPLPARPALTGPAAGRVYTYREVPPQVNLSWVTAGDPGTHRITIARDPNFGDIVLSETIEGPGFVHGNLPEGRYHWRVRAVDGWIEGPDSRPRTLELVRDALPPSLHVELPDGDVAGDHLTLSGAAEPGSRVWVGQRETSLAADGSFTQRIELKRGLNLLVVEAMDAAGNTTYRSALVSANY